MDSLFLSIIVPVYNAAAYLPECLDSLLTQDIPHQDYEIVCVNDGSRDNSLQVLQSFSERYSNIVIVDKENGGVTTARNAGLSKAQGDYIWFVDADDFLKTNILGTLRRQIREHNCDRLIIGCYIFDDALTEEEKKRSEQCQLPLNGPGQDSICVRSLFRRAFLQEHGLFFSHPELTHGEDGMFMYEVCLHKPSAVRRDEAIYFYRIHSGSAETADSVPGLQKKLRSYTRIVQLLDAYYRSGQKNARTANAIMNFSWFSWLTAASLPPKQAIDTRKQLKKLDFFPKNRLPECDLAQSYMTDRTDWIGKIYDRLYMNLHTFWGYTGMFLIRQLLRLKRSLHK